MSNASDNEDAKVFFSFGPLKTSNLGAFEQYISTTHVAVEDTQPKVNSGAGPRASASSTATDAKSGSIVDNFSLQNKEQNLKISIPQGLGAMGQIGIDQNINLGALSPRFRFGLLAFFDYTSASITAPTGWGIFTDPIIASASNQISAVGMIFGMRAYDSKMSNQHFQVFAETGIIRYQTTSTLIAHSESLDAYIVERDYLNVPIMLLEYSDEPLRNKNEFGMIVDLLAFRSPYMWNVGLSLGLKKAF